MKALVLQGGGYKGAYQFGVIDEIKDKYDTIFGTSVGALNALYVACDYHHRVSDIWAKVIYENLTFHKKSWKYYFEILFKKRLGLYENNLTNAITKVVEAEIMQKEFYVTVVDYYSGCCYYVKISPDRNVKWYRLQDGKLTLDIEQILPWNQIAEIIVASTSVPGYFKPVMLNNMMLYDGGIRDIAPLNGAVILGADEILCILCSPGTVKETKDINNLAKVLGRTIDIQTNEVANEDIRKFLEYNEIAGKFPGFKSLRQIKIDIIKPGYHLLDNSLSHKKEDLLKAYLHGKEHGTEYKLKVYDKSFEIIRKHRSNER